MARERRGGAEKGAVRTRKIRPHVPLLTPFILSASRLAANLLAYSREKGVWAKSRTKARVSGAGWVLGSGDGGKPRSPRCCSGDLRWSHFARSESAARATVGDRRYTP